MIEIGCKSVLGGWQTYVLGTDIVFGPIFNSSVDLWNWQALNLYGRKDKHGTVD